MLLADVRFGTPGKYNKLPKWLTDSLSQVFDTLFCNNFQPLKKQGLFSYSICARNKVIGRIQAGIILTVLNELLLLNLMF